MNIWDILPKKCQSLYNDSNFLQDSDQDCWFVGSYLDPNSLTINSSLEFDEKLMLKKVSKREQYFCQEGSRPDGQKTAWTTCFLFFFSPQLNIQFTEGVQWFYYRKTTGPPIPLWVGT